MDDENDDQGLHLDTGKYVEEARDYDPDDPENADESLVDKVKNALVGDEEMVNGDDEELDVEADEEEELDSKERG